MISSRRDRNNRRSSTCASNKDSLTRAFPLPLGEGMFPNHGSTVLTTFFFPAFTEADNFSVIMKNTLKLSVVLVPLLVTMMLVAQAPQPAASRPFNPVTEKMLENPSPDD